MRSNIHIKTHRPNLYYLTLLVFTRGGIGTSPKYSKTWHNIWRSVDLDSGVFNNQFGSKPYQVNNNQPTGGTHILYGAPKVQSGLQIFRAFCYFYGVV